MKRPKRAHKQVRKHWIESAVSGAARAEKLAKETWHRTDSLSPEILSAVLRDLLIEIGHVHGAAKNLAQDEVVRA